MSLPVASAGISICVKPFQRNQATNHYRQRRLCPHGHNLTARVPHFTVICHQPSRKCLHIYPYFPIRIRRYGARWLNWKIVRCCCILKVAIRSLNILFTIICCLRAFIYAIISYCVVRFICDERMCVCCFCIYLSPLRRVIFTSATTASPLTAAAVAAIISINAALNKKFIAFGLFFYCCVTATNIYLRYYCYYCCCFCISYEGRTKWRDTKKRFIIPATFRPCNNFVLLLVLPPSRHIPPPSMCGTFAFVRLCIDL